MPTRRDPATGKDTTPELTICDSTLAEYCRWEVCEGMTSEYHAIVISVDTQIESKNNKTKRTVWDIVRGDWDLFGEEMEGNA